MINQEFKAKGTKYQVLPNFGMCCRELGGAQSCEFSAMRVRYLLHDSANERLRLTMQGPNFDISISPISKKAKATDMPPIPRMCRLQLFVCPSGDASRQEMGDKRGSGVRGRSPRKNFGTTPFFMLGNALFIDRERPCLQQGENCSNATQH